MTDFDCCSPVGPDCRDGKHAACDGRAWDEHRDDTTSCACACHAPEAAHTPTDDEREALARWLHLRFGHAAPLSQPSTWDELSDRFRDAWNDLAADAPGFRRSEEPSAEGQGHMLCDRRLGCVRGELREAGKLSEPQGEPSACTNPNCPLERAHPGPCAPKDWPSDAQVRAALSAWFRRMIAGGWDDTHEERMRAALRAAAEVGGER